MKNFLRGGALPPAGRWKPQPHPAPTLLGGASILALWVLDLPPNFQTKTPPHEYSHFDLLVFYIFCGNFYYVVYFYFNSYLIAYFGPALVLPFLPREA